VTKKLDMARPPSPCGVGCLHVVAPPGTEVPDSAGFRGRMRDATSDAALNRSDAHPVEMNIIGFLMARRYRERVLEEIGKGSARGAGWWSRRLIQLYEEAGLVRLER
jgi:hypothetical protein